MNKEIKIRNTTIYIVEQNNPYHTAYWSLELMDFDTAKELWLQKKTYRAHGWDFWGDSVFMFNYIDEEHRETIMTFFINNGVKEEEAKYVTDELISKYQYYEDLEGVKMD